MTRRRYFSIAALVLLVVATYANSLRGVFVFDDHPAIRENPTLRTLGAWQVLAPPPDTGVGGRPAANLSFAINRTLGGTSAASFHVGNIVLHVAATLLLFGVVRRTMLLSRARDEGGAFWTALAAAALWAVHPLTTASVTYLSQRTELLMGACYIGTVYAFVRGIADGGRRWLGISVAACGLGMLSKEVMVTAPVLLWLFDRTFEVGSFGEAMRRRRWFYVGLASTWLLLAWAMASGLQQRSVGYGLGVSGFTYALTEAGAILRYLRLALWPSPLVFDYGPVYSTSIASVVAIVLMLGVVVWLLARRPRIGFLAAAFFVLLAPTSSFVPVAEQPIAENRMYLPLAVIAVLVVGLARTIVISARWRQTARSGDGAGIRKRATGAVVVFLVVAFALLAIQRNANYHSELQLWSDTVAKRPENWRGHFNRGVALLDRGRASDAAECFRQAIQLRPGEAKAHNSLGNALLDLNRPVEAVSAFAEAVRLNPLYARAWYNGGTAVLRSGNARAAIEHFGRALQLEPSFADARQALGNAWFQLNDPARAVVEYEAALRIDPSLADAHYSAGSACLELGRIDDAIAHFSAAARLKPDDGEIRNNLGAAFVRAGKFEEAIVAFEHALRLKPDYADARDNLQLARQAIRGTR